MNSLQSIHPARTLYTAELVRRGIRGIFLTLAAVATILDKGFPCRERGIAQM